MGRGCGDVGHQHPLENLSRHLRRKLCDRHRCPNTTDVWLGIHLCKITGVHADLSFCDPQRRHVLFPRRALLPHVRPFLLSFRLFAPSPIAHCRRGGIVFADGDTRSCTKLICIMQTASIIDITFPRIFTSRISPTPVNLTRSTTTHFLFRSLDDSFVLRSRASFHRSHCPSARVFCWVDAPKISRLRGSCRRLPLCCSTGCAPRSTFCGTRSSCPF